MSPGNSKDPATPAYRKLPGYSRHLGDARQLWCGPDHLLLVSTNPFSESYRRFYFRDLRALHVFPSWRRRWLYLPLFVPLIVGALMLADTNAKGDDPFLIVTGWYLIGISGLLALVNHLLGPTVNTFLWTGAHWLPLPPIRRARQARKLIEAIGDKVRQAQADLVIPAGASSGTHDAGDPHANAAGAANASGAGDAAPATS